MSETPNPGSSGQHCKLCGGTSFDLRHEWPVGDPWNQCTIPLAVWDCSDCGLTMLWPVPTAEQYPGRGDWHSKERKDLGRQYAWKKFRSKATRKLFGSRKERFVKACAKAKSGGRFLDVGCGDGALLDIARPFYDDCVGLEPSASAASLARAKGFEVIEGIIETADLKPESYDMIVMDSVIEHVSDPVEVLRICRRALKPGGMAALLTPKLGGFASTYRGRGWNGFRHGWHTFLFSGKTLGACYKKAGFKVLTNPRRDRPLDDILILWGKKEGAD